MNMKILLLGSKEYPFGVSSGFDRKAGGGIEVHVEKLGKYLSREGHDVHIITRRFPGQKCQETSGRIHIHRVRFLYNRYLRTFTFNTLSLYRAFKVIRKEKIDIIHSHGIVGSFFASMASKLTGKPLVVTPHGTTEEWGLFRIPLKIFERISFRSAKKIFFISKTAQRRLTSGKKLTYTLLTNGLDLEEIPKPSRKSWKGVRFGYIGRLEGVKGIPIAIEAFKSLPEGSEFLVAGEGSQKEEILKLIKSLKNIRFLGWSNPGSFYQQIDALVYPSKEKGQPIAILGAMAFRKAVITSIPNVIEDGKTGILIKPNQKELTEAMLSLIKNPKKASELGESARKSVLRLDWKTVIMDYIKEYKSLLK